jgi:hypothetical protein
LCDSEVETETITDASITTSIADQLKELPLLEEDELEVLVQPSPEPQIPTLEHFFRFLNCSYQSRNNVE